MQNVDQIWKPVEITDDEKKQLIGLIARDIRGDWSDVRYRLDVMRDLCEQIARNDMVEWLYENQRHIAEDGRWLREYFDL